MQNTACVEKTDFPQKSRLPMFGQSPISPTQAVKVHFNSPREDLKNAYLRSSLSASVRTQLALIAFSGVGRPPLATPLIRSNLVPIETTPQAPQLSGKISKIVFGNFSQIDFLHLKTCIYDPAYKIASVSTFTKE